MPAILNRLVRLGYEVLLPWSQDLDYDLANYVETEERHSRALKCRESASSASDVLLLTYINSGWLFLHFVKNMLVR
jgi:hypothetical protein